MGGLEEVVTTGDTCEGLSGGAGKIRTQSASLARWRVCRRHLDYMARRLGRPIRSGGETR
eukprot:4574532-Pyramimonas_sp.AAC.1